MGNFRQACPNHGALVPDGFEEMSAVDQRLVRDRRYPVARVGCALLKPVMNEGEEYEKIPRFIPYVDSAIWHGVAAVPLCSGHACGSGMERNQPDRQP